jgi:hypothetical protein
MIFFKSKQIHADRTRYGSVLPLPFNIVDKVENHKIGNDVQNCWWEGRGRGAEVGYKVFCLVTVGRYSSKVHFYVLVDSMTGGESGR